MVKYRGAGVPFQIGLFFNIGNENSGGFGIIGSFLSFY